MLKILSTSQFAKFVVGEMMWHDDGKLNPWSTLIFHECLLGVGCDNIQLQPVLSGVGILDNGPDENHLGVNKAGPRHPRDLDPAI